MKTMKKKTLPTYTVLIRTPAGTQTIIETNDFYKSQTDICPVQGLMPPVHRRAGAEDT